MTLALIALQDIAASFKVLRNVIDNPSIAPQIRADATQELYHLRATYELAILTALTERN